jgi:chromosome segregation ATPase
MDANAAVKEYVAKFRCIRNKIEKIHNARLEEISKDVHRLEMQYSDLVNAWDIDKALMEQTIEEVLSKIKSKQKEQEHVLKETASLNQKVQERRMKVDEYEKVISSKKQALQKQLEETSQKEAGAKERLREFREARDAANKQLQKALEKLKVSLPEAEKFFQDTITSLVMSTKAIESKIRDEGRQWDILCAQRESDQLLNSARFLREEAACALESKGIISSILLEHASHSVHLGDEIEGLRLQMRSIV